MAKMRVIKSMITGEPNSQPAKAAGDQSSVPNIPYKRPVLALASEQATGQSKKRSRSAQTEQNLVNEDSVELPSSGEHKPSSVSD
ncbi:hypothetical protein CsSME_00012960 [Camellia sinensis var. sinensis]